MTYRPIYVIPFFLSLIIACEQEVTDKNTNSLQYSRTPSHLQQPVYRLAVHPLYNPKKLSEAYQPLINHINHLMPEIKLELEASRNYQTYEKKFRKSEPAFLLPNPWQTLQAMKNRYHVIAMAGNADDFKGIFIVRKDSGIKQPADLKGRVVSYPSHTALAAAIMPQYFLHNNGIDIKQDIENRYVGSQESSIMNVYLKKSAAGATWPPPWRLFKKDFPEEAAQLELIWQTPPLLNNSVMVRDDVPLSIQTKVAKILTELGNTAETRVILDNMETVRFHAADDASYDRVRDYIKRFEKDVRPVESK
ncbi:MAG: PhnD/SsuA/transferrin family substrate-binding protein [Gammaproteobacteria bacterium]|nr:PhnD/SsuA/transferrin family substrate-binding protein [Gammaproteobacteria bacterium]